MKGNRDRNNPVVAAEAVKEMWTLLRSNVVSYFLQVLFAADTRANTLPVGVDMDLKGNVTTMKLVGALTVTCITLCYNHPHGLC